MLEIWQNDSDEFSENGKKKKKKKKELQKKLKCHKKTQIPLKQSWTFFYYYLKLTWTSMEWQENITTNMYPTSFSILFFIKSHHQNELRVGCANLSYPNLRIDGEGNQSLPNLTHMNNGSGFLRTKWIRVKLGWF